MGGVPGCSGKLASLPGRYREEFVLAKILGAYLYGTSCVSQLLLLRPHLGLLRWLIGKEFAWNARDTGDAGLIPGSGRPPGEGCGNPLQLFLPEKSHGQRSLAGYSPWSHKELDTTEHTPGNLIRRRRMDRR